MQGLIDPVGGESGCTAKTLGAMGFLQPGCAGTNEGRPDSCRMLWPSQPRSNQVTAVKHLCMIWLGGRTSR